MAHYSEMEFLFSSPTNRDNINQQLNATSDGNTRNIFNSDYTVYKHGTTTGTNKIKAHLQTNIYNNEENSINPYIKLLNSFDTTTGNPGAGLRLKPSDFAYLRDLGVYPINRMAILRRFPDGIFVNENLETMTNEPISTIIGWIKPDVNFTKIDFSETWTITNSRFDEKLAEILKKATGGIDISKLIPVPSFAQGMLFELYNKMGLLDSSAQNTSTDGTTHTKWGLNNIPVGDPNVLKEGPVRNPETQNIKSAFSFELETTYEQKLIGDVDPGSALLDILDNIHTMGTSNMSFYWGDGSKIIQDAKTANKGKAHDIKEWWILVNSIAVQFWDTLTNLFKTELTKMEDKLAVAQTSAAAKDKKTQQDSAAAIKNKQANIDKWKTQIENYNSHMKNYDSNGKIDAQNKIKLLQTKIDKENNEGKSSIPQSVKLGEDMIKSKADGANLDLLEKGIGAALGILQTILTSTISIHRFELRGTIELMVGGQDSAAPWHLMIGNPYSPWLNTSHIIVKSCTIETSNEMGFNDMPQRLTAKFNCEFSRALGAQELLRMFNNTYSRTYSASPISNTKVNTNTTTPKIVDAAEKTPGTTLDPSIENYLHNKTGNWYSYQQRKDMAKKAGIQNYTGTAEQNTQWLGSLRAQENNNGTN